MPVLLPDAKLAYFFVPKVACTSLKSMFFELENDRPFEPYRASGKLKTVHNVYGTSLFEQMRHERFADCTRLALVRDPVARMVSCYGDKILKRSVLTGPQERRKLNRLGLPTEPSFAEFVTHLEAYQEVSGMIRHHTLSICTHLGRDPGYYTRVFRFSELTALVAEIGRIAGKTPNLPHKQKSAPGVEAVTPSAEDTRQIKALFAEDYEHYGDWL